MKMLIPMLCLLFLVSLLHSEEIQLNHVDRHDWEATISNTAYGETHMYYFFDFNPISNKVEISVKDTHLNEVESLILKYKQIDINRFPDQIVLYQENIDQPSFIIDYGGRYEINLTTTEDSGISVLSFESVKNDYQRLGLQGIQNYDRVRLRTAPNLESQKIGSLMKGDIVSILNRSAYRMVINDMNAYWFKVKTEEGIVGWTYGYFLELGHVLISDESDNVMVFQKSLSLDQGNNQLLIFYRDNEKVDDSGWLMSNKTLIFEEEKVIVLTNSKDQLGFMGSFDNFAETPMTYLFDIHGNLIKDFEVSNYNFILNKINDAPLFYTIESHGLDRDQKWANRCMIYDLAGNVVNQKIYNETVSTFVFGYKGNQFELALEEP